MISMNLPVDLFISPMNPHETVDFCHPTEIRPPEAVRRSPQRYRPADLVIYPDVTTGKCSSSFFSG
jgi:hypothetical protein